MKNIEKSILFVSDLDGTLLRSDKTICQLTHDVIKQIEEAGHFFTIATARSLNSAWPFIKTLELQQPIILYNGALIYDIKNKSYIHSQFLKKTDITFIIEAMFHNKVLPIVHALNENYESKVLYIDACNASEQKYFNEKLQQDPERFIQCTKAEIIEKSLQLSVLEIMCIVDTDFKFYFQPNALKVYRSEDIYCPGHDWIQMTHHDSNKGQAIRELRKHYKVSQVISFGDNINDLDMFAVSDVACAVEGAHPQALSVADEIIGSHNNAAVATKLQTYL